MTHMNGDTENNNNKGHNALKEAHDTGTVRPVQARALMHMKHL